MKTKYFEFQEQQTKVKGHPLDLAHVAHVAHVANFFNYEQIKILTSKQILQRLPIDFSQLRAGNTPLNLLNEICHIIFCLY